MKTRILAETANSIAVSLHYQAIAIAKLSLDCVSYGVHKLHQTYAISCHYNAVTGKRFPDMRAGRVASRNGPGTYSQQIIQQSSHIRRPHKLLVLKIVGALRRCPGCAQEVDRNATPYRARRRAGRAPPATCLRRDARVEHQSAVLAFRIKAGMMHDTMPISGRPLPSSAVTGDLVRITLLLLLLPQMIARSR